VTGGYRPDTTLAMSLQWYPGHISKARREMAALMPSQDLVIELLDARLPRSSSNPVVSGQHRPRPESGLMTR
jgi:ribosome biogenesis GTPase A